MDQNQPLQPIDKTGWILLALLGLCLTYSGYLAYKGIDWTVLERLEATPLVLPTQVPTPSLILTPTKKN